MRAWFTGYTVYLNSDFESKINNLVYILATYSGQGVTSEIPIDKTLNSSSRHQIILFDSDGANVFNINSGWGSVESQSNESKSITIGDDSVTISGTSWYQMCLLIIVY